MEWNFTMFMESYSIKTILYFAKLMSSVFAGRYGFIYAHIILMNMKKIKNLLRGSLLFSCTNKRSIKKRYIRISNLFSC